MGTGVHELKHAAKLQEWSAKVAECRAIIGTVLTIDIIAGVTSN